jgi:replication initiation protein RepC
MGYEPLSSFGRPITAVCLERLAPGPQTLHPVDKWALLREIGVARKRLGVTHRQITVLQALLALHKGSDLTPDDRNGLVVHPSNATLSARLNGMPASTLRRHLAILVDTGLIARRDSPNGKRFVRRYRDGARDVFGFDLTPLARRASEIEALAQAIRTEDDCRDRLRRTVSLMQRDLAAIVAFGRTDCPDVEIWDELESLAATSSRILRRRLTSDALRTLRMSLVEALSAANAVFEADHLNATTTQNEHHQQNSNKDLTESEAGRKYGDRPNDCVQKRPEDQPIEARKENCDHATQNTSYTLPLSMVVAACPQLRSYATEPLDRWQRFYNLAETIRPMIGIPVTAWTDATSQMGPENASIVLAAMLERLEHIKSPGAYIRALTKRYVEGTFHCGPMVRALLREAT